jgi:rhodanese-related sulfurtransferase
MKKLVMLFVSIAFVLTLTACGKDELPAIPDTVDMTNIDEYLNRPDVQYVDVRNFDERMKNGYIMGFENLPVIHYLEASNILVQTDNNWEFTTNNLLNESALRSFFDENKTIFLMCAGGTRAGFVADALESLGYDVRNIGGFADYSGEYMVAGDGSYMVDVLVEGPYTPGVYYGVDPVSGYVATVVINDNGGIGYVFFDAIVGNTTKQTLGYNYGMASISGGMEWFEHANMLADYIVDNQGWDGILLLETPYDESWNALNVPHHIIEFDAENNPDSVAGVTIGVEGFIYAWNDAIAQASDADLGIITTIVTNDKWAAAHENAFNYLDGVYFGLDEEDGYLAKVTIEDGFIVDVFFDALYDIYIGCDNGSVIDEAITQEDCVDPNVAVFATTTKQVLQDGYTLASGFTWAFEANELASAIIKYQEWRDAWTMIDDGGHLQFDQSVSAVADDVAGVTISVEGFKAAWDEAISQAISD